MAGRRWPVDALAAAAHADNLAHLARMVGRSHETLRRLAGIGLSDTQADTFAVRAGLHPTEVWHDWHTTTTTPERNTP